MNNEDNFELVPKNEQEDVVEFLKDSFGIEFSFNELMPKELEQLGYQKIPLLELRNLDALFKFAPQLIVNEINGKAIEQAFKEATINSYKCFLDPSMHLATFKGNSDVFLGAGLDNTTNKVSGQARWIKNDSALSISNAPNIALSAFNALSAVTGQYFMAQVNAKLSMIKNEIDELKQYLDAIKKSELDAALQDLNDIIRHLQYIKNNSERTHATIVQIEGAKKVARRNISLYSDQIKKVVMRASKTDKENMISKNIDDLWQYMIQYRSAVYVYNYAQILKIYLNDITDVNELCLFHDEISMTSNIYKEQYDKMVLWTKWYLKATNSLNKASIVGILTSAGMGIISSYLTHNILSGGQTALKINELFDDNRKKKKEFHIARNNEYQTQLNNMELIDSSISTMEKYIELTGRKAEIVSIEGEYFVINVLLIEYP